MSFSRAPLLAALVLLLPLLAWGQTIYYVSQQELRRHGRTLPKGSDSHTCEQARNPATARATLNGGSACLQGGDTLMIGPGIYPELLLGYYSSSTCHPSDAAVQQPCAVIPNGLDAEHPTRLIGTGEVRIAPGPRGLPGGGGAVTFYESSKWVHLEGLAITSEQGNGIQIGGATGMTVTRSQIQATGNGIYASPQARYLTVTTTEIHHGAPWCDPRVQTSPPCPHGMYICGQDHVVTDNYVHHNANYGIQISCEQGGIARVTVARNRVEYNRGVGIRVGASDSAAVANLLVKNGLGMTITGNPLIAHNTFDGIHPQTAYDDPFGLWVDGNQARIVNNLFTNQKNSWYMMQQRSGSSFVPVDPARVHHNGCDVSGNVGCTNVHPTTAWYRDLATGDYTLAEGSPARSAGVAETGVQRDLIQAPYTTPDLGSYAWRGTPAPPPDTTPPTVQITNPPPHEHVFGTALPLTATASDNVAVVSVQFQVDGQPQGAALTSVPYQVLWDTTTVSNGPHTFTAVARDGAGNETTATPRTLNVHNAPAPTPAPVVLSCNGTITGSTFALACTQPVEGRR